MGAIYFFPKSLVHKKKSVSRTRRKIVIRTAHQRRQRKMKKSPLARSKRRLAAQQTGSGSSKASGRQIPEVITFLKHSTIGVVTHAMAFKSLKDQRSNTANGKYGNYWEITFQERPSPLNIFSELVFEQYHYFYKAMLVEYNCRGK